MPKEGKIVHEIPPVRRNVRHTRHEIKWDEYATLAKLTGQPVLAGQNIRNSTVKSVRQYTRYPFVDDTGHIAVRFRSKTIGEDGERYGDVYLEWIPNTPAAPTTPKEA